MEYLAQITIQGQSKNGCYKFQSDSLDEIRTWAKRIGKPGDELLIMKNGDKISTGRTFTL